MESEQFMILGYMFLLALMSIHLEISAYFNLIRGRYKDAKIEFIVCGFYWILIAGVFYLMVLYND